MNSSPHRSPDLLIIGGGAIGLSIAYEATQKGMSVLLLERERVGARASWAGAGMLNCRPTPYPEPLNRASFPHLLRKSNSNPDSDRITTSNIATGSPDHRNEKPSNSLSEPEPDYHDLLAASIKKHQAWHQDLLHETDIDYEYHLCGALELVTEARLKKEGQSFFDRMLLGSQCRQSPISKLTPNEARELEPNLDVNKVVFGYHFPNDGQIRNTRFSKALALACRQRGAILREGVEVKELWIERDRVLGAILNDGEKINAHRTIVCNGAWASKFDLLSEHVHRYRKIEPVRGQILCYKISPPVCSRLITCGERYLVPRPDGTLLVGSTTERVGFEAVTTVDGQEKLKEFAASFFPSLREQKPVQGWADLRPGLTKRHPILGPVPDIANLFVAVGHFRNGLCLAPITGEVMVGHLLGEAPSALSKVWMPQRVPIGRKGNEVNYS